MEYIILYRDQKEKERKKHFQKHFPHYFTAIPYKASLSQLNISILPVSALTYPYKIFKCTPLLYLQKSKYRSTRPAYLLL